MRLKCYIGLTKNIYIFGPMLTLLYTGVFLVINEYITMTGGDCSQIIKKELWMIVAWIGCWVGANIINHILWKYCSVEEE